MIGGFLIEILPMVQRDETDPSFRRNVIRLWCVDRNGDECAVYAEPYDLAAGPSLGDQIWWQSGKILFDGDRRVLVKLGNSFDPGRGVAA